MLSVARAWYESKRSCAEKSDHVELLGRVVRVLDLLSRGTSSAVIKGIEVDHTLRRAAAPCSVPKLLDQARILEGETLPDPAAFAKRLSSVLARGLTA